ncbi:hypothetical protein Bealeia1_01978 (plasmid) [Candidatus Bealeia paramacronuclearis]|uniref:Uncharacterized protein n=1 Tax=Candidatus Bealeia paramacronuclearis TaxID=1921001 RepID=A0ABZ2C5N6_9PROT
MTQFSLGFEFEDTYWNGKFINELKYNGIPVAAGAAKTAQRVAPFAICTNSNREHLWYLSLDGDHVELITAPIYSNKNPLEKIQQIKKFH